jgi:hypothetical protein
VTGADLPRGSAIRQQISPLTRLNTKYLKATNNLKWKHFGQKGCIMYEEFVPFDEPSVIGTATDLVCSLCCSNPDPGTGLCAGVDACKASVDEQTARWQADAQCGEKVKDRLREMVFDGVTVHEMGHNMGLRHNFKGSYDAMNYFDRYWEIRKLDNTIGPRTSDPRTPAENQAGIMVPSYSSIMDYGAKWNSDFFGLGRWDTAAILHAYSGFTQVFKNVAPARFKELGTIQNFRTFSWPTPFDWQSLTAINYTRLHYDAVANPTGIVDTTEANRTWVPTPWITPQLVGTDEIWMTDQVIEQIVNGTSTKRVMVPYKFCSDEFRGSSLGCNYFDEGADLYEISRNWIDDPNQYTGRIFGRYFDGLQNHLQYYVLFLTILQDTGNWTNQEINDFFTDQDTGWGNFTVAVAESLDMFARVLNQPQAGTYVQGTRMDGSSYYYMFGEPEWYPCGTPGLDFCVPYVTGKMWEDSWDQDFGYQWYLRKIRYGHFYDRPLAIQVLGEATNNFMGRDTQGDVRKYTINYARLFPNQLKALLTGINSQFLGGADAVASFAVGENPYAPVFCGNDPDSGYAVIDHRSATMPWVEPCSQTGGTNQGFVDPGDTFTTQLYATTLGLAYFPLSYSQEFLDAARIYVIGESQPDFSTLPPEATWIEFQDPFSYKTYRAVKYPDVNVGNQDPLADPAQTVMVSASIGATMLEQAEAIKQVYTTALAAYNPADPASVTDFDRAKQNMQNYVINLDMARSASYINEHPDFTLTPQ